jgi:hypothetical protein
MESRKRHGKIILQSILFSNIVFLSSCSAPPKPMPAPPPPACDGILIPKKGCLEDSKTPTGGVRGYKDDNESVYQHR